MPLKPFVKSLDEVEEKYRDAYLESEGGFLLDVDVEADPRVHGLKTALQKERGEAKTARAELGKYKELGASPEDLADLQRLAKAAQDGKQGAQAQLDSLKKQLLDEHAKVLAAKDTEIKELNGALYETLAENAARAALEKAGGSVRLLLPHVLRNLKVEKGDDGKRRAVVLDGKGQIRIADAQGSPMTPEQYVAELRGQDDFAPAFSGTGSTGSGASSSSKHAGGSGGDSMPPEQRLARAFAGTTRK